MYVMAVPLYLLFSFHRILYYRPPKLLVMVSKYELVDFNSLDPSNPPYHCVDIAPSTRPQRRCHNPISGSNMDIAGVWIKKISSQKTTTLDELERLAGLCLCQKNHQNQARAVARNWYNDIQQNNTSSPITVSHTTTVSATTACNSSRTTIQPVISSTPSDSITSQIRASRSTIPLLEQEVADKDTRITNLENEAKVTGRNLRRSERAVQDLKYEKSILEETNTELRANYVMLSQSSEANTSRLTRQLEESSTQRRELSTKISTFESDSEARAKNEQDLKDKITNLETQLKCASDKPQQSNSTITRLTTQLETPARAQKASETQISTWIQETSQATTPTQTLTTKPSTLQTRLENAGDANKLCSTQAAEALQQSALVENDIDTGIEVLLRELAEEEDDLEAGMTRLGWEFRVAVDGSEGLDAGIMELSTEFAEERGGWGDRCVEYERSLDASVDGEKGFGGMEEQLREERCGYFAEFCRGLLTCR